MWRQAIGETPMTGRVRMKPVGREEGLAARTEHLVDGSARADVGRARGWVDGSTLTALIGGASQAEHRLQCGRDTRHDREIKDAAHDGLDVRAIERTDDGTEIPLELHQRRRMDHVIGTDRYDRDIGPRVENRRELMHQYVGYASTAHGEAGEVHAGTEPGGRLGDEDVPG